MHTDMNVRMLITCSVYYLPDWELNPSGASKHSAEEQLIHCFLVVTPPYTIFRDHTGIFTPHCVCCSVAAVPSEAVGTLI